MSDLTLSDLMNTVYGDADDRGWHDRWHHLNDADDREGIVDHTVTKLALSVTEVAESIEEVRNGKPPLYFMLDGRVVLRLQALGLSNREIGATLGISRRVVWGETVKAGSATPNRRILPAATWARVEELLDDGCSGTEAARTVGVTATAVLAHFPGRGWTPAQSNAHRRVIHGKRWAEGVAQG